MRLALFKVFFDTAIVILFLFGPDPHLVVGTGPPFWLGPHANGSSQILLRLSIAAAREAREYSDELLYAGLLGFSYSWLQLPNLSISVGDLFRLFFQPYFLPTQPCLASWYIRRGKKEPTNLGVFIGTPKGRRIPGQAVLMRWWSGPPLLVIVSCPPEPAVQLSTTKASGTLLAWTPPGPIDARTPTKAEKRFFLSKGVHPDLFKNRRAYAVSDESAKLFDVSRKAFVELAGQFGLSEDDLSRITEAKRRLSAFRPSSYTERRAAKGLREFLGVASPKKQRGRPGRTTEDRLQMHRDADQLRGEGKNTDQIVRVLAQRYELKHSYVRRILEDARP